MFEIKLTDRSTVASIAACMMLVGVVCQAIGTLRHGFEWTEFLGATIFLTAGIGLIVIGLLRIDRLERFIVSLTGAVFFGIDASFARRSVPMLFALIASPIFFLGCVMALRIIHG